MPRALFEKTGSAVYISHLDLMRVFQRAFKRAGLPLTHTQGFSPRPSVSIALPMSVGVESRCELLDFDLETDQITNKEIMDRLNDALIDGVKVLEVYSDCRKIREIAFLDCIVTMQYDSGVPAGAETQLMELFSRECLLVEKRGKNGVAQQDIIPLIRHFNFERADDRTMKLAARICCQNPALNPMQMVAAIEKYLPELKPDFARFCRNEIYYNNESIFR